MTEGKDYRNTKYCKVLERVREKKQELEMEIHRDFPKTKIIYNKVKERGGIYNRKFAKIYNEKCGYCGISLGLLPLESFEVDHFVNEASFPDTLQGRQDAGKMENLVWSCISCNRGKLGITIEDSYKRILDTDQGNIGKVFERDKKFYIQIQTQYQNDEFINKFYNELHLGYERRRIDYMLLRLDRIIEMETNEKKRAVLENSLILLLKKRNRMGIKQRPSIALIG